jgi:hypothetical protein
MIVLYAGSKPPTKAHPWDYPCTAAGKDLHIMTTFFEIKKMGKKKRRKFMRMIRKTRNKAREYWGWIPGYYGIYEASTKGRIRSVTREITQEDANGVDYTRTMKGKIVSSRKEGGRPRVGLWKGNKVKYFDVHVLVLRTFKGPCPPGKEGCHKDDDVNHNHLSNLYYGTRSQNMKDCIRNGNWRNQYGKMRRQRKKK